MASFLSGINIQAVLIALGASVFTHQVSFRVGSKTVSIVDTAPNAPTHFTFNLAEQAAEAVLAGKTGSITIGDVELIVA